MGRRRTACNACAIIKSACSKESPCARCQRLDLTCEYDTPLPVRGPTSPMKVIGIRTRRQHKRSPNGCVNCLSRRKKCDEQRPMCSDCKRLGLSCQPRISGTRRCSPEASSPGVTHSTPSREHVEEDIEYHFEATCPSPADQSESDSRFMNLQRDWMILIDDDGAHEVARRHNLNESSAMIVQPADRVSDEAPSLGTMFPITALNNITGVTSKRLRDWSIGEKHLLNHYQQVVSRALVVVDDDENPFLLDIVPMALEHSLVRHSLVALSACHLSKVYPDFKRNALKHRSLALRGLKVELAKHDGIEVSLTATLLLALLEMCEGNSRKWILHLHGAKALMSYHLCETVEYPLSFLFDLHNFLSCIAATTSHTSHYAFKTVQDSRVLLLARQRRLGIHPLFGFAKGIYASLDRINMLAAHRTDHESCLSHDNALLNEARDIELELQGWSPPQESTGVEGRELREVTAAALSIQWATIMRLYQIMHGYDVSSRRVQTSVGNILSALSIIRPGSLVEARILFPLFMAGIGSSTKANRLTVEYRLNIMETTIGFGNITGAHKLLDHVWQKMNDGETAVNWEQLMHRDYPGVVLI